MKALIVIMTIVLSVFLTITAVFTVDSATVRKAEITSILATDSLAIVEDYFEGNIYASDLRETFIKSFEDSGHSKSTSIDVTVFNADAGRGIVNILVEMTYDQPNGRPRLISYNRVYIREAQSDPDAENQYSFIRTISSEFYKTEDGQFVAEANGGLKSDSIWKTSEYEAILDTAFSLIN